MTDARPSIELVVTDLDGTLWERPDSVPQRTKDALHDVLGGDVPLLVATGRRIVSTRDPLAELGVSPPSVVLNGALGLDLHTLDRFHVGGFEPEDAARVLRVFADHGIDPCVYVDHDAPSVWVGDAPSTARAHLASFGDDVGTAVLTEVVEQHAVLAFGVLGIDPAVAEAIGTTIRSVATPHVAPDRQYGGAAVTVAPPTGSKWDGIAAFCDARDLDPSAVLVLGDGPNDVEMLDAARVAVVPEDAHPLALERADHVIGRAADGGWADVIELL